VQSPPRVRLVSTGTVLIFVVVLIFCGPAAWTALLRATGGSLGPAAFSSLSFVNPYIAIQPTTIGQPIEVVLANHFRNTRTFAWRAYENSHTLTTGTLSVPSGGTVQFSVPTTGASRGTVYINEVGSTVTVSAPVVGPKKHG